MADKKWEDLSRKEKVEVLQELLGAMQERREFKAKLDALTEEAEIRAQLQRLELETQLEEMDKRIKAFMAKLPK
jgi:hypothetical protein